MNKLQQYFPMIRTREEVYGEIQKKHELLMEFNGWDTIYQEQFLDFCSGARGIKMMYDSFFKKLMNPDSTPERMEDLLSAILRREIRILKVLPNEATNISDNKALMVMDIVVEMTDGSIANVEVQKVGYAFPGQRSACYSADLLLRQYMRVKSEKSKKREHFSYRDMKRVYTIVLFESSPQEFKNYPENYIHYSKQCTDTGLTIDLLQEFVFIPLDIFKKSHHNKAITNKLEAWLTFFSMDAPDSIIQLIEQYPEFTRLYEDVYRLCMNIERMMGMYSEALRELDRNTAQYMIEEMKDTIDHLKTEIAQNTAELQNTKEAIRNQKIELQNQATEIQNKAAEIQSKDAEIQSKDAEIQSKDAEIQRLLQQIEAMKKIQS